MTAKDSEPASIEDPPAPMEEKEEQEEQTDVPSSDLPPIIPSSSPLVSATLAPNVTTEPAMEPKAVSVASNDCSTALSSPVEASPAKPTVTSPTTLDGTVETSPDTSHITSASDSLTSTGANIVSLSVAHLQFHSFSASSNFGNSDQEEDFPNVLTFKGVSVTLENNSVWKQFHRCGTEMILAKQGRRMFPYCRYRLAGLDPDQMYSLVLSIVPSDSYKYRWHDFKWEKIAQAEQQTQGLIRAFAHQNSPCRGSEWMGSLVSFYKLKLTNNPQLQEGHIILQSMQRYIPRIHVIPIPDNGVLRPDVPVVMGPESVTFTFPQTEFMAVTTYQNFKITQLKINHNPFAKGFREVGNNPRLQRIPQKVNPVVKLVIQTVVLAPAVTNDKQEAVDLSTKNETTPAPAAAEPETKLVLKPIMSTSSSKEDQYVPCIRGNHALGELVVVGERPPVEAEEQPNAAAVTPKIRKGFRFTHKAISRTSSFKTSTPASSRGYHKRRKRINRRWANSRGRLWKAAAAASPTVVHSPSLTVAMQPELDDVEGLLFVSFTSKEALDVHVVDKPANKSSNASAVAQTTIQEWKKTAEEITETNEEKITRFESALLQDLKVFKHRQVIHPVLQEVGLKLTSLNQTKPVNLQYLGVLLPLPPPNVPERDDAPAPGEAGLPFISRTGKTNDFTKIKGWRSKFVKSKETSSNCDGSLKNLSAFCSNMLDEYLESEAQFISERAAAFSTNPEGSVSYQLPAKSSSYVKTLDSVLKHRNTTLKPPEVAHRPDPQPHRATPSSGLTSAASYAEAPSTQQPASVKEQLNTDTKTSQKQSRLALKHPGFTKNHIKMMQLERRVLNEGPYRTLLTPDRLTVALSAVLTKQMLHSQLPKKIEHAQPESEGPECGQDFCRLGCVCSSLQQQSRVPFHCRRPECMFCCLCSESKIPKQTGAEGSQQNDPVYAMNNMEHVVQTSSGSRAKKLWSRDIFDEDPEPLIIPEMAPLQKIPVKVQKRSSLPRQSQPIREEDKDPVYKYFESMMTCARVRGFNIKPPPKVTKPTTPDTSAPRSTEKPRETSSNILLKKSLTSVLNVKKAAAGKKSQRSASDEVGVKKKIEIQSECSWDKDRRKILEVLYQRLMKDRLSHRFWIGPYHIRPITKISIQKPSGTVITHRVNISLPSKPSHSGESDDSDEENHADESLLGNSDEELEDGPVVVAPFVSGVIPAGRLRARTKPVGCDTSGLIQVNGKSYNQARLLLGSMGALHPANRLAAYVTGRLKLPPTVFSTSSQKSDPETKINPLDGLRVKTAGAEVTSVITARKTSDVKTTGQHPDNLLQTEEKRKESIASPDNSPDLSPINPVKSLMEKQLSSSGLFQSISASSPVTLTVSPSLKTPSFLTQNGTCSFRICPPANQATEGKSQPGVSLPGGFTIIQLPKPKRDGAATQTQSVKTTNSRHPPKKTDSSTSRRSAPAVDVKWLDIFARAKEMIKSAEPGAFTRQMFEEKMRSAENEKVKAWKTESNLDIISDDFSSDFSDLEGEEDEDDEDDDQVDIETVEEGKQGMAIAKMKEVVRKALQDSRDSSEGFGIISELAKSQLEEQLDAMSNNKGGQSKHTVLERRRRLELRGYFDKLQDVLQSDPKAPRSRLLSQAVEEIQHLSETSQSLEKEKQELAQKQASYMKELSILSGETDELIKHTLDEIDEKQKMREKTDKFRPFFSYLLQTRAAILEATSSKRQTHSGSDSLSGKSSKLHPFVAAALNSVSEKPPTQKPLYGPLAVFSDALLRFNAPPKKKRAGDQEASDRGEEQQVEASEQVETDPAEPQTEPPPPPPPPPPTAAVPPQIAKAPLVSISQKSKKPISQNPLPLIRSKTGRIILPASLKPLGQGYYTLTFMNQDTTEEEKFPKIKPAPAKPPQTNQISTNTPTSDTVQTSNSQPNPSSSSLPPPLDLVNKPCFLSLTGLTAATETSSANASQGAARLTIQHVHPVPTLTALPSDRSPASVEPPVARRGRGRPRKHPRPETLQTADACENDTSLLVDEVKTETETVEVTNPRDVNTPPSSLKRSRGRPRKDSSKPERMWRPPAYRAKRSLSPESDGDSPERFSDAVVCKEETPLVGITSTTRHLTRGALGKDFPSAKKRSWIDLEKELDPEFEYE